MPENGLATRPLTWLPGYSPGRMTGWMTGWKYGTGGRMIRVWTEKPGSPDCMPGLQKVPGSALDPALS
ncbi:MAG: hypothetical protein ABIJ86_03970 [Spirochaetota bacterium]